MVPMFQAFTMSIDAKCQEIVYGATIRLLPIVPLTLVGPRLFAVNGPHHTSLDNQVGQSPYHRKETWKTIYRLSAQSSCPYPVLCLRWPLLQPPNVQARVRAESRFALFHTSA
ncbi:hypothetical protein TNCV_2841021 [Trichonephila clavipes]|uniref:Uncharacterized protein n=1 Tax=Trichonephila clavipes TaxID=2585209 RepID=A0A8X6RYZ9_TRICX|nr:hypothetical protein TNCV_2841021 [Trichonephila clavipes]